MSFWKASQVQAYGRAEATSMRFPRMPNYRSRLSILLLLLPSYSAIQGSPARHLCSRTMSTGPSRKILPRGRKTPCSSCDGDVAGTIGMWPCCQDYIDNVNAPHSVAGHDARNTCRSKSAQRSKYFEVGNLAGTMWYLHNEVAV